MLSISQDREYEGGAFNRFILTSSTYRVGINSKLGGRGGSGSFSRYHVNRPKGPRLMVGMMVVCLEDSRRGNGFDIDVGCAKLDHSRR
jgi:hypothetical protein